MTKKCTACGAMWYCSREHQRSHWKAHKVECRGKAKGGAADAGDGTAGGAGAAGGATAPEGKDAGEATAVASPPSTQQQAPQSTQAEAMDESKRQAAKVAEKATGRQAFQFEGRTVYEWRQTLEEVLIFIKPPPGVTAKMINCEITATALTVGLVGSEAPFINEPFPYKVKTDESFWTMDDGEIEINMQKMAKGETWPAALAGHGKIDQFTRGEIQKKMMLERFQEENPGFDFSGADFSGSAPDPRTFMGGVSYK